MMLRGFFQAPTGFEPVIRVLQTHALPLGYGAMHGLKWTRTTDPTLIRRAL